MTHNHEKTDFVGLRGARDLAASRMQSVNSIGLPAMTIPAEALREARTIADIADKARLCERWHEIRGNGHGTFEVAYQLICEERAALSPAPAELVATMTKALPGGTVDDATYEQVEGALDRLEAPCRSLDGRWLKLHERIAMLPAVTPPPSPDVAGVVVVDKLTQRAIEAKDQDDFNFFRDVTTLLTTLSAERERLPADVIELVISARIVAYEDQSKEALRDLDKAVEAFSERVPWENEPAEEKDNA